MTPGPQLPMGRGDPPDILQWLQCPCTLPGPPGRPQTSPPSPLTRTPARPPPPPRGPEEHRFPRLSRAASPCPGTRSRGCAGTGLGSAALVGFGSPGRGWRKGCEQQGMGTGIPGSALREETDAPAKEVVLPAAGSDGRGHLSSLHFSRKKPSLDRQRFASTSAPKKAALVG